MTQEIKLTTDQMRLMSLFQNITKATARDCVEDEKLDRLIFVVNEGKMGLAIGKGGAHIKTLQNKINRVSQLFPTSNIAHSPSQTLFQHTFIMRQFL
mgnify:CR=1 FL=1